MPTQHRAIQSRQALIRSAAETFLEKGVPAAGMVEISRRARLSKGALYFHFTSKDDLTLAVRDAALASLNDIEEGFLRSPEPLTVAVRDFAVELFGRVQSDAVLRAGLRLRPETAPGLDIHALEQRWYTLFLDKAVTCGTGAPVGVGGGLPDPHPSDAEPRRTAQLLTSVVVGLLHLGGSDRTWWDTEAVTGLWGLLPATSDRVATAGIPAPAQVPAG
ncbi:TetR/AcrR family transcriptional regulator (plasmid) [Streptomyces sp. BHT-5-2]|uniref:TetR/AcrR family transcriptional regulator n=1 Tax=unclassified Streptomyces TaxID=2593676 RepID=UPI001C8D7FDE|nr:TetR/AcrR family transcriptional regulator [Streptomyces sp. BHT-5-2]QZL08395.1 TetR/AcrR family transcriptional regulator [Streptomyces sp. BHT-5-2]